MSINDQVVTYYNKKHKTWRLLQGRQTFYDKDRYLREWETEAEAIEWAKANLHASVCKEL